MKVPCIICGAAGSHDPGCAAESPRLIALRGTCQGYHGKRLASELSEAQFDDLVAFIEDNDDKGHLEFEYAVNRWFIDRPKPKQWTAMTELALAANTRAKGLPGTMRGRKI